MNICLTDQLLKGHWFVKLTQSTAELTGSSRATEEIAVESHRLVYFPIFGAGEVMVQRSVSRLFT